MLFFDKKIVQPTDVEVKESPLHGRGVYAKKKIFKGCLIERAPVVFLSAEAKESLRFTRLFNYYFLIKNQEMPAAFCFGYASFYNHSPDANAFYSFSSKRNTLDIYAYITIEPGTEITINYNGHPRNKEAVYFPQQNKE